MTARRLAGRILSSGGDSPAISAARFFELAFGRSASARSTSRTGGSAAHEQ